MDERAYDQNWKSRCDWCGWPLRVTVEEGCILDNCSVRPLPQHNVTWEYKQEIRKLESQLTVANVKAGKLEQVIRAAITMYDSQSFRGENLDRWATWAAMMLAVEQALANTEES